MAIGYEREQASLKEKLAAVKNRVANMDMRESCIREFIEKAEQYVEMPKLTPEQDGFPVIESLVPKKMRETA